MHRGTGSGRACHVRVAKTYGLDLAAAWPRLWLLVPDTVRSELSGARDTFNASARLTAWAVFNLVLEAWWWSALPITLVTRTAAILKGRLATGNLADLIESAIDLHGSELGVPLGLPGGLTPATGTQLATRMLNSGGIPPHPLAD